MKYLGEYLAIHCGGIDNIFPHHTNEIAQSEAFLGHKWCRYWVHGEHLNDKAGKMSKSNGEFLTVSLLESKGYKPLAYRYLCLTSHYRNTLTFGFDIMDGASREYNKLKNKTLSLSDDGILDNEKINYYDSKFRDAISNDLNTSSAITVLYEVLKDNELNDNTKRELVKMFDSVLSLDLLVEENTSIDLDLKNYINDMIEKRNGYKKEKNFSEADRIRDELKSKGILIKDTREGTLYEIVG